MPPHPPTPPPLDRARAIVSDGLSVLVPDREAWQFGDLWSFSSEEHRRLEVVRDRVRSYLGLSDHKRPLCIAVFGPPGSGKSVGVNQIFKQLVAEKIASLGWTEVNLTQFESPRDIARAVATAVTILKGAGSPVPFIFFDEFDAATRGAPLGWLSWFLAPMQDGKFMVDGAPFEIAKAVYVFAGGTAATMEEFGARDREAFRLAKGPDFVSRVHSHIDVRGPNDQCAQELRRGAALRFALDAVAKRTGKTYTLDDAFLSDLVYAGRYRHGQRSVEAVITMMAEQADPSTPLGRAALPADFLLDMQVDRGPLDPKTIGGLIGLSGGGFPTGKEREKRDDIWEKLALSVWTLGATVAYGGNWDPGGLTDTLTKISLPSRLGDDDLVEPRLEVHAMAAPPASDPRVTVVMVPAPSIPGATEPILKAAHLFRMRWQSGVRCRARVVLSGRTDDYSGRMPGIVEEAMIALALRHPIYVLGGFGGAAKLVGELLGLATTASPPVSIAPATVLDLNAVAQLFRPSGFEELPLSTEEALSYIAGHAIGGLGWTPNGLTVEENRRLFDLSGDDEGEREAAVGLVRRGLLRVFDK